MGKKSFFLGEVGNGAKYKLVVNMVMGRWLSGNVISTIKALYSYFTHCLGWTHLCDMGDDTHIMQWQYYDNILY